MHEPSSKTQARKLIERNTTAIMLFKAAIAKHGACPGYVQSLQCVEAESAYYYEWIRER